MRLTPLNYLILVLNAAIDGGAIAAMDELLKRIENETLFPWLAEKYRGYMDLSLLDEADRREFNERMKDFVCLDIERKWGVRNNGLAALLALTNELIQRRDWELDEDELPYKIPVPSQN